MHISMKFFWFVSEQTMISGKHKYEELSRLLQYDHFGGFS